jgi:hypothetical protein
LKPAVPAHLAVTAARKAAASWTRLITPVNNGCKSYAYYRWSLKLFLYMATCIQDMRYDWIVELENAVHNMHLLSLIASKTEILSPRLT